MTRQRAPQQVTPPPIVQVRIVSGVEIARCPTRSWASAHWIPEHAIEECDPGARTALRVFEAAQEAKYKRRAELLKQRRALERERAIRMIRDHFGKGGRV